MPCAYGFESLRPHHKKRGRLKRSASFFCEVRSSAAAATADCSANSSSQQPPNWATRISLRNSVPETASWGTEYACRAQNRLLGYATCFLRNSVLKIGFYGTEGIFGVRKGLLWYAMRFHSGAPVHDPSPPVVRNGYPCGAGGRKTTTGEKQPPRHKRGGHNI